MNFDNLIKINEKKAAREFPEISKLVNTIWKQCQHGKQTRVKFKKNGAL